MPDPTASRRLAAAFGLACLGSLGLGLALASWARAPAGRPSAAVAVKVPSASEDPGRRLARAIGLARASTVALEYDARDASGRRRVATGVVVSDRGDVLSVWVDPPADLGSRPGPGRPSIVARDEAGHRHRAVWVAADPETGLTLLRVEADDVPPIRAAAKGPDLGAEILVIGNPYGLGHSVGRGYVGGVGRRVENGPRPLGGLIQVQVPLHPGDGGALLADLDGGWLGVVRGGLAPRDAGPARGDDDLGLAIPAGDALWVAGQLRDRGKVERAYLGVWFTPESESESEPEARAESEGAEFSGVLPGSPADLAGLKGGDRIVRLDGRPVRTAADVTDRLDRTAAGAEVALEFARAGARQTRTLRTTSRPPAALAAGPPARPDPPTTGPELLQRRIDELERREKPAATP